MAEEIRAYYAGRRRLAIMMGRDPTTFTDRDVAVSTHGLALVGNLARLCSSRSHFDICCHQLFPLKMRAHS